MTVAFSIALASAASIALGAPGGQSGEAAYRYHLSTSFGTVPFAGAFLSYDRSHRELFVMGDGLVRVFNEAGMEVFTFGDDPDVGMIRGLAALEDGDLLVQAVREGGPKLVRCTFRGEYVRMVELKGVPAGYERTVWGRMRYEGGKVYLADLGAMKVLVADAEGNTLATYDVAQKLDVKDPENVGLRGFNVDRQGNILFTIQPNFRGYVMSPAGEIQEFGQRGSAPGKFNIVGGIARDDDGYTYVADILKSAILVFDRELRWVREFGYRSNAPSGPGLAAPEELAAAGHGELFISQNAKRGVSVYQYLSVSKGEATGSL
jgi:hypothetical protein